MRPGHRQRRGDHKTVAGTGRGQNGDDPGE